MNMSVSGYIVFTFALFMLGLFMEILCVHLGLWSYPHPDIFGIPYWIPFGWIGGGYVVVFILKLVAQAFPS